MIKFWPRYDNLKVIKKIIHFWWFDFLPQFWALLQCMAWLPPPLEQRPHFSCTTLSGAVHDHDRDVHLSARWHPLSQVTSQSRWWIGLLTRMSFFWTGQVRIRTSTQQKTSGQHSRDCSTASSSLPRTWNNWPSTWRSPGRFLAGTEKCSSTFVTQWRGGSQVCWQLREVTPNTILTPFFETYINDYCYTYTSTYTKLINWSDLNPELISTIFFWIWFFSV